MNANPGADPWAVTDRDKLKYQEQFKALNPQNGFVTGAQAKGFFLQSQLPPLVLGQIWALADTDSDGKMNLNEFSIACKLINLKLRGMELPKFLPPSLMASAMGGGTPTEPPKAAMGPGVIAPKPIVPPAPTAAALPGAVPAVPGIVPGTLPGILPQVVPATVVPPPVPIAPPAKIVSPPGVEPKAVPLTPTPPQSNPPSRHTSISERAPSIESPQAEWAIKAPEKRKYTQIFNATDRARSGYLSGVQVRAILVQSKLPQATLAQIWTLSDLDCDGRLSCDEFILIMFLCDRLMKGEKIPVTLPPDWIPPSFRKTKSRQGSVSGSVGGGVTSAAGSRPGSTPTSRHASVSSQGAADADPSAGLPQTSFEDKRKENFDKGQAELDRRRKLLQDQQRKEKEERERKEREEADKRERARLDAERKQQQELERQLQKQRELEQEREEQRQRELEAKEAARKELERQRQQEWEQARIAEMNAQKQREQERVLKQKAHNTQLNVELSTLNEKIKDLSQRICDTRAGVTNVKCVIDGMRSQRDSSMSEMSSLKARIKEQNAKLLQLTQERAKWDAKARGAPTDAAQQEQLNAAFASKQLVIKQLRDKVENLRQEIDGRKEDIDANDLQVAEVKGELSALIGKCEALYADYDTQRTQVLELKYNRRNESVSAWDAAPAASAWGTTSALPNDTAATAAVSATGGGIRYRAIYEFSARTTDEISFMPDDIISYAPLPHDQNAEPGWMRGEINGHAGYFPESYVEKIEDDYAAAVQEPAAVVAAAPAAVEATDLSAGYGAPTAAAYADSNEADAFNGGVEYYIAAYPYESAEAGDLSFGAGEMVMVTKKEGEWWTGTIGGRTGMFPSNYVQKADVGSGEAPPLAVDGVVADDDASKESGFNGTAATAYEAPAASTPTATAAAAMDTQPGGGGFSNEVITATQREAIAAAISQTPSAAAAAAAKEAAANAEDTRTNEDLDTEVSQINTQPKGQSEPAESYSRPMSRTSSMTPGMRAKRSEIAQVIAPYEATSSEQLSLTRGQLIMIRKKTDTGWWEGELQAKGRRRQIGWFPATYVKVLQGGRNSGRNTPVSGSRIEMTEQILDKVIALYPYKAQNDDELSFDKDDIISVLGRDEPEWWRGELNGLTGLFPSNYVGPFVTSGKRLNGQS